MNLKTLTILSSILITTTVHAEIISKEIDYKQGDTIMKGMLAYDDDIKGKRPGVLIVHQWWGHNKHARDKAKMLAKEGYVAFAVDMYGDRKNADHPDDAGKFFMQSRKYAISQSPFYSCDGYTQRTAQCRIR